MDSVPPRVATVVLVGADGHPIGRLPPLTVATPWWHEAWPIVDAVREAHGVEVGVVRMLDSELPRPHGGGMTYLAELHGEVSRGLSAALEPTDWVSDIQPLRAPWAEVGGA